MEFLTKHKKIFIIIMVVLCLLTIVFTINPSYFSSTARNAVGFVINPINETLSDGGRWIGDRINFLIEMNRLYDRVKELETENNQLKRESVRLNEAQKENEKLSELLDMSYEYRDYPMVGAKIIGKDPSDWYDAYKINKGLKDGIKVNMAVLAPGGLMGIVRECNDSDSIVISLIDERSSISARSLRHDDKGFVKGDSELMRQGLCRMEYIDIDAEIIPDDLILTSSLSVYYPKDIVIGRVKEVILDTNGLTKHAIIEPTVALTHLDTLLIVTKDVKP